MNVFDLALDLGDKEWFIRLHKITNEFQNKVPSIITKSGNEYEFGIDCNIDK